METLELIAVSLSCFIMTLYLSAYICAAGLPASISATYYRTRRKWLFPTVISLTGLLALVPLLNHTPESYQFVAFFIVAATLFVASAPAFKEEMVGKIHAGAATVLGLAALTWIILAAGIPYATIVGVIIGLVRRRNFVFWLEAGLLVDIYANLFALLHICSSASA